MGAKQSKEEKTATSGWQRLVKRQGHLSYYLHHTSDINPSRGLVGQQLPWQKRERDKTFLYAATRQSKLKGRTTKKKENN